MSEQASCIWPAGAVLGEGPLWHPREKRLYWVDIKQPAVHAINPATGARRSWPMPEDIGCIVPRRGGGFIAGLKTGFARIDLDRGSIERIGNPEPDQPGNRFNDGKCDGAGRFWAGTMDDQVKRPTGWLYCLDTQGKWTRRDGPYPCTNGPAFSPDDRTLYHTDTMGRTVYAFDLGADGTPSRKRAFVRFAEVDGYPDGMTVDSGGCVWVAHWGGWRVTRFRPDGTAERTIRLPVAQVTSCAFGEEDLRTLYITTASTGLSWAEREAQPLAGGLFAVRTDTAGLECRFYGG
ncbi:MAG: SMP-30/gluconolactonase/LRE family protein [Alphaproteobacteria bacterium]|nr:SMP-30/gluconolactonase/LRE family protein [Alphaproteobacteria bacterium]